MSEYITAPPSHLPSQQSGDPNVRADQRALADLMGRCARGSARRRMALLARGLRRWMKRHLVGAVVLLALLSVAISVAA